MRRSRSALAIPKYWEGARLCAEIYRGACLNIHRDILEAIGYGARKLLLILYLLFVVLCAFIPTRATCEAAFRGELFVIPVTMSGDADINDFVLKYSDGKLNCERISGHSKTNIDLYDPILITQSVARVIAPWRPIEIYSVQYLPVFFALTTPLACLSLRDAWIVWSVLTCLSLLASVLLLCEGSINKPFEILFGLAACIASLPSTYLLYDGQTSGFELFAISIAFLALRRGRYFFAGIACGATLLKMQFLPIALIPGLCLGRKRFLFGFLVMCAIETLVSIATVGLGSLFNFLRTNYFCEVTRAYTGLNDIKSMANLRSCLSVLLSNDQVVTWISFALYLGACLLAVYLWIIIYPSLKKRMNSAFELVSTLSIISLLVSSPHVYIYDYVILIIPSIWLYSWSVNSASISNSNIWAQRALKYTVLITIAAIPLLPFFVYLPVDCFSKLMIRRYLYVAYSALLFCLAALVLAREQYSTRHQI